jgi:peptidoglycan/LPS O-acetylase OafA/YrhL
VTSAQLLALFGYFWNVPIALARGWGSSPPILDAFWSLAAQEQFYVFWVPVVLLCSRRTAVRVAVGCIAAAPLVRLALWRWDPSGTALSVLMPARMDAVSAGALIALVGGAPAARDQLRRWAAPAVGVAALVVASIAWRGTGWTAASWPTAVLGLTVLNALATGVVAWAVMAGPESLLARTLDCLPLRVLARYSYGMYVVHMLVNMWLRGNLFADGEGVWWDSPALTQLAFTLLAGALTLALATLSWELLERQLLKLQRFFPRIERVAPRAAGIAAPVPSVAAAAGWPPRLELGAARQTTTRASGGTAG